MVEQRILDSFQTMWGPFPEPVMLVHKSRTILAVNDLARTIGIPAGVKCFSLNPEVGVGENHCGRCKANLALKTGETVTTREAMGDKTVLGYWMPLAEAPDVYVHFGIGTAEIMAAAKGPCANSSELVNL
ncbi:MAG TPA: hypothetical protein VM578_13165 [Candidatus Saccharimonadales bacterium]|nr:hypothetical protein [Candidatus Saccharimonadales bacterium]